ncbi:MAG: sigma-70 family RNA polymerase sigma factor [Planctomycetes bacterium]|nr:sigma-70 family RNA polymerase sigma factor [Planctomycetota bacterium]
MLSTSVSLLERIKIPEDHAAWERFVHLYTPFLDQIAQYLRLDEAEAADLLQDVFLHLMHKLPEFTYQPTGSFRGWLKTVTINKCRERLRQRRGTVDLNNVDPNHLADEDGLNAFWDSHHAREVTVRALRLMQTEFQEKTWQACWQHIVEDRPAAEVAEQLGISVAAVYTYSSRVLKRLRQELRDLID